MGYTTWKFSNLSNRFLLDFYAWTVSVWKPLHFWSLEWHGKTWFQIGPFEFMYHPQPQSRPTPRAGDTATPTQAGKRGITK